MMTVRHWLLVAPLVLTLALAGAPTAAGQSTPTGEVASGTCIPEGGIPQQDSYLIGMSQANEGEPWRQAMNDQIAAAAAQNNAKQVADVENFLQQGIDLLIISPNEAAPLTDVVAEVCAEGVPVIVLDRKVNGDQFTMWIGADNEEIGQRAGEYAANFCTEQNLDPCNIIEIRGLEGSTPAKERGDGFRAGIAVNPSATIIAQQNADWLREKAIPVSQAMFQANPDVNVVYAHNDPMAEAAIISAQNAGVNLDEILFIGIDALPTPDGGIRSVIDGRIDVTYVYPTGGAQAIDNAVQILEQGVTPPAEIVLETEEVVPENAQQLLDKYTGGGMAATPTS